MIDLKKISLMVVNMYGVLILVMDIRTLGIIKRLMIIILEEDMLTDLMMVQFLFAASRTTSHEAFCCKNALYRSPVIDFL